MKVYCRMMTALLLRTPLVKRWIVAMSMWPPSSTGIGRRLRTARFRLMSTVNQSTRRMSSEML